MINMTLVAQWVNFFIVYLVVRRFFLRPVLAVVHQEDAHLHSLQSSIASRTELLARHHAELQLQWKVFQESFSNALPTLDQAQAITTHDTKPPLTLYNPSPESISLLTHEVLKTSLAKVPDVQW